ncbi:MAG: ADP-ribosylglycohydrolase family protein, partial [Aggregatilineales bacterium]
MTTHPTTPTNNTHEERLKRARLSLEGLSVGDSLGAFFEMCSPDKLPAAIINRTPPDTKDWYFTDDTNMALSIYAILRQYQRIEQDALAASFAEHFSRLRGYGMGARRLMKKMAQGEDWREISKTMFRGGSYGNGGAMRVAPVGAYFAD